MVQKMKKRHKLHPTRHGDVMYAVFCVICAKGVDKCNFYGIIYYIDIFSWLFPTNKKYFKEK